MKVSRTTIVNYIKEYKLEEILEEARESLIDFVESKLVSNINDGKETSTIFFLKTKARHRGYGDDGSSIQINTEKTKITLGNGKSFEI